MSAAKRQVIQRLHDMGFSDNDIRSAITECGYNVEACADWIVNRKQDKKPRLFVGMEVWVFSREDQEWCPGNVVSITKQLLSIIFNGHDFRWLEKESDLYKIQSDKPEALKKHSSMGQFDEEAIVDDPYNNDGLQQHEYAPPRQDETDYYVTFTESVLGLELYSDEDGFNCIVGRCVSTIARQKVTPGSQIVQVNDRWLANYRFEEIRDAVKQAARQPPLAVTFRIKKNLLRRNKAEAQQVEAQAPPPPAAAPNTANLFPSASPTSPESPPDNKALAPPKSNQAANGGSIPNSLEEKSSQPNGNEEDGSEFMGTFGFGECDKLQIGDHIDHRDDVGRFLLATIVDKDECKVKIHYEGWNSKWDTWCDYQSETHRFAAPRSISRKPNTRFRDLKIRDYVDINPIQRHRGWRVGQIRRMDKYSGQAQIVYKEDGQEFLYWAHLNNPQEIAPFMTRAAETIALQQQMADLQEDKPPPPDHHQEDEEEVKPKPPPVQPMQPMPIQQFNNSNVQNEHQQQLLNTFMSPPATTATTTNTQATDRSMGYNSGMDMPTIPYNPAMDSIQPPPANMDANVMNGAHSMNNNIGSMPNNLLNTGGSMPTNNIWNTSPMAPQHQKSKSRVLPRTIKNKKLPPKPAKNMSKKRNKGINRSRTQPLPDQQQNIQIMNPMNPHNPMNNMNHMNMNMNPMNPHNHQHQMNQYQPNPMHNMPPPPTTSFADISYNAQFQPPPQPSPNNGANFMHGQTTYTAQW
eukprot:30545_1